MRAGDLLDEGERAIAGSEVIVHFLSDPPRVQAARILSHVLGRDPRPGANVSATDVRRYRRLVARRVAAEPVALITGTATFRGMTIAARRGVFVPRASVQALAGEAVRRIRRRARPVAVDVGTGSGAIALALANEVPHATVLGVDISQPAISLARLNARRLGLPVRFVRSDLLGSLPAELRGGVDLVVMYPPYIEKSEVRRLPAEMRDFDPHDALTDGSRAGTRLIERAAHEAGEWLRPGGWFLILVPVFMAREISAMVRGAGLRRVRSVVGRPDYYRILAARR